MILTTYRFAIDIGTTRVGAFTQCTLPTIKWETQPVTEGGLNTYIHHLPKGRPEGRITLQRGLAISTILFDWYLAAMAEDFQRKSVTVHMLDLSRKPVFSLILKDAIPIEWSGPRLEGNSNGMVIESLTLLGGEITLEWLGSRIADLQ